MITVAVCDDEPYFADRLSGMITQYLGKKGIEASVAVFNSGEELIRSNHDWDILLMDVRLPGQNGMETVVQLRKTGCSSQVIFITSYQDYVFQAFDVDALHYLIKPVNEQTLGQILDRAVERVSPNGANTLILTKGNTSHLIYMRDIYYCETYSHQIFIYTTSEKYSYFGTLDSLEQKLDKRFFRCHRSYIVNLNYVVGKDGDTAIMSGGSRVFISRRRQKEFTHRLLEIFRTGAL